MKVKIQGTIYYDTTSWSAFEHHFTFYPFTGPYSGHVEVRPHEIEVEVPDNFDPRPQQIAELREKLTQYSAEFERRRTDVLRQISELQAIEYSPAVEVSEVERCGLAPVKREGGPVPEEM